MPHVTDTQSHSKTSSEHANPEHWIDLSDVALGTIVERATTESHNALYCLPEKPELFIAKGRVAVKRTIDENSRKVAVVSALLKVLGHTYDWIWCFAVAEVIDAVKD